MTTPRSRVVPFGRALNSTENLCRPSDEEILLESSMKHQDDDETFWLECINQTISLQRPVKKYQGFKGFDEAEAAADAATDALNDAGASAGATTGKYVAPHLRAGGSRLTAAPSADQERDERTLRVTNLSDHVKEGDLGELFGRVGRVQRVFVAKHQDTKVCKGFAFVTMGSKEDALKAVSKLDRHPYDNLLLKVEWAKPATGVRK
jgi:translation initiation factor 3 subunit G